METKYYTTNSPSYTKEHNTYMDTLLYSLALNKRNDEDLQIGYFDEDEVYFAINEAGQKMLEHLANIDVIAEVN